MSVKYEHFDGMVWPTEDDGELEWRLRYLDTVSRTDALTAASYIASYKALIKKTVKQREHIVRCLKKRRKSEELSESDQSCGSAGSQDKGKT